MLSKTRRYGVLDCIIFTQIWALVGKMWGKILVFGK